MKCGVVVFPGSNCDHDVFHVAGRRGADRRPSCSGTARPTCSAASWWCCPAASPTATTCAPARWRRCRRSWTRCAGTRAPAASSSASATASRSCSSRDCCPARCDATAACASSARTSCCASSAPTSPFTRRYREGQLLRLPIAHAEGCYTDSRGGARRARSAPAASSSATSTTSGERTAVGQPERLVAIDRRDHQRRGNVLGMMPHPERCAEEILGNRDGLALFAGLVEAGLELMAPSSQVRA